MSAGKSIKEQDSSAKDDQWVVHTSKITADSLEQWSALHAQQQEQPFYLHATWISAMSTALFDDTLIMASAYLGPSAAAITPNTLPDMMIPLMRSKRHRLSLPAHDHLTLGGALVNAALTQPQIVSAIASVMKTCQASKIELGNLPDESPILAQLHNRTEFDVGDAPWLLSPSRESAWFDLQSDDPVIPGKLRRNLQRLKRKLETIGEVDSQCLHGDAAQEAFDTFLTVEASGWKGSNGTGTAINRSEELVHFYRTLLASNEPGLTPMINQLTLDDEIIAVQYALCTDTCIYLLKIGYLESYAQYAPGSLLLDAVMSHATELGLSRLSLVTNPAWASRWHPNILPVWRLACHRSHASMLGARTVMGLKTTCKNLSVIRPSFVSGQ